jgi:hypothetical protein
VVHGTVYKASLQRSVSGFEGIVSRDEYFYEDHKCRNSTE